MNPRCPDCGVEMHAVDVTTSDGFGLGVKTDEKREGILGTLGLNERHELDPVTCPEWGLVRLYADVGE